MRLPVYLPLLVTSLATWLHRLRRGPSQREHRDPRAASPDRVGPHPAGLVNLSDQGFFLGLARFELAAEQRPIPRSRACGPVV
jgi:hypothetical protein